MTKATKKTIGTAKKSKAAGLADLLTAIDGAGITAAFERLTIGGLREDTEAALSWARAEARVLRDEAVW